MVKWEYHTVTLTSRYDWEIDKELNGFGEEGWEVAGIYHGFLDPLLKAVLKGPKPEDVISRSI